MRILVVNAGSSSLKLRVLSPGEELLVASDLPPLGVAGTSEGLERFLLEAGPFDAVGHRVVHGGPEFRDSVVVTDQVLGWLRRLSSWAPLHNPPAISALEAVQRLVPGVPNVACFDTAFHATIPEPAAVYAIPRAWTKERGVRRYGFHGLSHAYAARRTAELLRRAPEELRVVTCHLGAGASLAAVAFGRSVDTTMGFTPLEGLVMATRSGSVDPGALLWLQRSSGISPEEMERVLEKESGVMALAGTADMREVIRRSDGGDERARFAIDVYVHRLIGSIAAMAASMGGVDAVAFTGGVGQGSARIRRDACRGLGFLGVALDGAMNQAAGTEDADLSPEGTRVRVVLVHAREDLEIAREVRRVAPLRKP
jgi:acetate kinase